MKILQIGPAWVDIPPKDYGGCEWVIANLVKGLSRLGHDVTLFATKNSKVDGNLIYAFDIPFLDQGISWDAGLPPLIHYFEAFKLASEFDFVHAHLSSGTDLIVLPFLAQLTQKNIPNLLTIHSRWPFEPVSEKMFLKYYANKILAVNISKVMHKTLPSKFRDGGYVYNSLDLSKMVFHPKKGNYLTWLGKIIPCKGIAKAIEVAKKAGEQLIFAGVVDKHLEKSVRYFKEEVMPLIDGDQIKYLGPADLNLKNKLLGGAKAFLNPISWEEPFGMVILESLACGTPVISFERGAASELIQDGKVGFLVKNKEEMLKAIKRVPEIDRKVCREYVGKYFSVDVAALKYLNLYRQEITYQKSLQEKVLPQAREQIIYDRAFKNHFP